MEELVSARIAPPPQAKGKYLKTAVFDSEGRPCASAATWRRDECLTIPPSQPPTAMARLTGRWLWGGVLFHHFGHFQVESLARLWALSDAEPLDGIIFVERQKKGRLLPFEQEYLKLLQCDLPVKLCAEPTEVERLVVAGQGFGLGGISKATDRFKNFIATRFAKDIAPNGSDKLFISRSKQPLEKGGFVGEAILDTRMAAAGYEVFWPEEHSLSAQIARYKAARQIVSFDGSALHLLAMLGNPNQKVAIIQRRSRISSRGLRTHIESFTGKEPVLINAFYTETEPLFGNKRLISDLDLEKLGTALKSKGLIDTTLPWGPLYENELAQIETEE